MPKTVFPNNSAAGNRFPFQIILGLSKANEDASEATYQASVVYHSKLYSSFALNGDKIEFGQLISITDLDFFKSLDGFPKSKKKYYCVLEIELKDFKAEKAVIKWVEENKEDDLIPFELEQEAGKQSKARIIIGVIISDQKEFTISNEESANQISDSQYVMQYVNTNLVLTFISIDGVPLLYPVPISGGEIGN